MSPFLATVADLLVASLLLVTIVTSVRLSRRITAMKAGEEGMRRTIAELIAATQKADLAIGALKATVVDSERTLADRLGAAARHTERLAQEVQAGEAVIERVSKIADISRRLSSEEADPGRAAPSALPTPDRDAGLRAAIRLARDVAERSGRRLDGRAA
jgi:hypothetical protein